jgi:hypothetical protein
VAVAVPVLVPGGWCCGKTLWCHFDTACGTHCRRCVTRCRCCVVYSSRSRRRRTMCATSSPATVRHRVVVAAPSLCVWPLPLSVVVVVVARPLQRAWVPSRSSGLPAGDPVARPLLVSRLRRRPPRRSVRRLAARCPSVCVPCLRADSALVVHAGANGQDFSGRPLRVRLDRFA